MNLAIANTGGVRILSAVSTAGVTAGTLDQPIKRLVKVKYNESHPFMVCCTLVTPRFIRFPI